VVAALTYLIQEDRASTYEFSSIEISIKNSLALLFLLGLIDMGRNIRLYVIFLIVSILLQRESRALAYKMKVSTYANLVIASLAMLFSIDKVFLKFVAILKPIFDFLWIPISYILLAFSKVLASIFVLIFKVIGNKGVNELPEEFRKLFEKGSPTDKVEQVYQGANFPPAIKIIIELAVICFFIFLIYSIFKGKETFIKDGESFIEIKTEKIEEASRGKRKKHNYGKDIKSKILYIFFSFEGIAKSKGIYENFMTARELGDKTKMSVKKYNDIDNLINTYNEVKFSKRTPNMEQYEEVKKIYKTLKKEL
jgi:hypothetical protein